LFFNFSEMSYFMPDARPSNYLLLSQPALTHLPLPGDKDV